MLEFEASQFLFLAFPVWYVFYRWAALPGETAWLLALPCWAYFVTRALPPDATGDLWRAVEFAQRYGGWLLPIPLWLGLRHWGRTAGVTRWLRLALVALLLFGIAGPKWNLGGKGIDIIVIADRSRSMPDKAEEEVRELIKSLQDKRAPGDRVAVITFGSTGQIEELLSEKQQLAEFNQPINPDGSDLDDALQKAISLIDPNRPARILILSDGESNGRSPLASARRARELNVPIDFRIFERSTLGDVAVRTLSLPRTVGPNEPFLFSATVYSDRDVKAEVRLERSTVISGQMVRKTIATGRKQLLAGRNDLHFGDSLSRGGTHEYFIRVQVDEDPRLDNNEWRDEVFVEAGPRMLLLVKDENAKKGRLARLLTDEKNGIPTDVFVAETQPLSKLQLDRYRAVILEDVPADKLGFQKMARLANFVTERGGGLMMTGGLNSFGSGGYYKSPLEEVLPVSMELRKEHQKLRAAIAVVLDRSGSMGQIVVGGRTKMDLANLGTEECVRMLSANDMLSVIAVDTKPDVKQPLTKLTNKNDTISRIRSIQSGGGGIYVDVGLQAAKEQLDNAKGYKTRHIILFSDARDTEISPKTFGNGEADRQQAIINQVKQLRAANVTVSVIGLGEKTNIHGPLLERIAEAGGGRAMFTEDARDLPRLFTQDTMKVARQTFLRKDKEHPNGYRGLRLKGPFLVGQLGADKFPGLDGYNLTYRKKRAEVAVLSDDRYKSPWTAFWYRGLGRVAALPFELDGKYTGDFATWKNRADFLLTHARWLLSGDDPRKLFIESERRGQGAVVTIELDPNGPDALTAIPLLKVIPPGAEVEKTRHPVFEWVDEHLLEARFRLDKLGIFRTQIVTGPNRSLRGPSISLPYSPEFFPRTGQPSGRETLSGIAEISAGRERTSVLEMLDRSHLPRLPRMVSLVPAIAVAVILLVVLEIAGRRLALWERSHLPSAVPDDEQAAPQTRRFWQDWKPPWRGRKRKPASTPPSSEAAGSDKSPQPAPASIGQLLEQAKAQARRRRGE